MAWFVVWGVWYMAQCVLWPGDAVSCGVCGRVGLCVVRVLWLVAGCHCCVRASKGIFAPLSRKLIFHKCLG